MDLASIDTILGKILPGKHPTIFLIIAIIGGYIFQSRIQKSLHLTKILWLIGTSGIYLLIYLSFKMMNL